MTHYTNDATTKQWILTASVDGNMVDFECIINSDNEPDFWTCQELAQNHGCEFWMVDELQIESIA